MIKLDKSLVLDLSIPASSCVLFDRTNVFVPSRSHPSSLDKPLFETTVSLMTDPIDHLADLFPY